MHNYEIRYLSLGMICIYKILFFFFEFFPQNVFTTLLELLSNLL